MSTEERHIFYSAVVQVPTRRPIPTVTGRIPVNLLLYKETRFWFDGPEDYEDVVPQTLVAVEGFLGCRERVSRIAAQQLLQMPIPEQEVPPIIDKLVQKLSVVSDVPSHMPITVLILDITVSLMGSADYDQVIDWVARQTFSYLGHPIRGGEVIGEPSASYKASRTPAATSFIHGLKRLRLDTLEEAVIRKTPTCAICLQDFAESVEQLITCLPCKHHYYVNCIVLCLEINHICPLCRHPMPTAEACEPLTNATAN
ncbi:PREDICTED: RING finger protein 44-like [Fragaria vesca subsp. vesca]|uniref:RING finger protein 44-like n=1 Tax=Fragaria vesca subsp. vesca TaxID=101020 RepID=UPI0002C32E7C|nr:PREDICTED: RING finger protein 44-like [Fragaria vesca subsp. vesca]XP_011458248.1 PREDICTED: RING finger protein 44-like [Fragaria vesca subsp. vesca]